MTQPTRSSKPQKSGQQFALPEGTVWEGELRVKPPEDRAERVHRRRKDNWSFWVKDALTYIVALLIVLATAVYCFWVLFHSSSSKDEKQWVMSTLTSLLVGIIGYLFGKITK